jgi:hypothetical protein
MKDKATRLTEWMLSGDTGISSKTMVARFEGTSCQWRGYPHDPDDLGRCIRLLRAVPEYLPRLPEMRAEGPVWAALVDAWWELSDLFLQEEPSGRAPKCYARMQEIIDAAEGRS